eukprot:Gb_34137 [translate_table: standard]
MRGCFGFSVVEFVNKRRRRYWRSQGLQSRRVELSNGTTMHCWLFNGSQEFESCTKPAVLLIHGFGADSLTGWDKQIGALGKNFKLIIPDLIFFGSSTTTNSQRSEIFQAESMKSMLDSLGVEAVTVVGHSYGGFVAFWMAHKYPNLVNRLVIVSSALCMTPSTNDPLLKEFGASDIKEVLLPTNVNDFKKGFRFVIYKMPWLPTCIYEDFMETMGGNRDLRAELLDGIVIGSKNSPLLPVINQDVLIVWGERDGIFRVEEAYLLQKHLGDRATMVVLKECGHAPPFEKPNELNEALLNFFNKY